MLYDTHMHTPLCQHARGMPEAYAQAAGERGLDGIIMTCHNPMPEGYSAGTRMRGDQMDEYVAMVHAAREKMAGVVDVRLGLECDYLPEFEPWLEKQLAEGSFEYVLGSVHPQLKDYTRRYPRQSSVQFQKQYFELLAAAAETGLFHTLSHPDLVKKVEADHWNPEAILDHIKRCLDRIAATGTAMELNTAGHKNKPLNEFYPAPVILREMRRREIPVVIGSDAHDPHHVADAFPEALRYLAEAGYEHTHLFLGSQRFTVSIAEQWQALSHESGASSDAGSS